MLVVCVCNSSRENGYLQIENKIILFLPFDPKVLTFFKRRKVSVASFSIWNAYNSNPFSVNCVEQTNSKMMTTVRFNTCICGCKYFLYNNLTATWIMWFQFEKLPYVDFPSNGRGLSNSMISLHPIASPSFELSAKFSTSLLSFVGIK